METGTKSRERYLEGRPGAIMQRRGCRVDTTGAPLHEGGACGEVERSVPGGREGMNKGLGVCKCVVSSGYRGQVMVSRGTQEQFRHQIPTCVFPHHQAINSILTLSAGR